MQLLNPSGAWALTSLAAIAALYLLKRRYVDQVVPSTLIWRRALNDLSADRPFQKLKKNLLLLCQLLMALLIALSLMRPALSGGAGSEAVFVFDVSASMGAMDAGQSRLERSAEDAWAIAGRMGAGARITVITAGREVRQVLARSADLPSSGARWTRSPPKRAAQRSRRTVGGPGAVSGRPRASSPTSTPIPPRPRAPARYCARRFPARTTARSHRWRLTVPRRLRASSTTARRAA
jgi:hypothetical protein